MAVFYWLWRVKHCLFFIIKDEDTEKQVKNCGPSLKKASTTKATITLDLMSYTSLYSVSYIFILSFKMY